MKNKKKICVVATIIATILLIHSCSKKENRGQNEDVQTLKKLKINPRPIITEKEMKKQIETSAAEKVDNKVLVDIPKENTLNKEVFSEKKRAKENLYISLKKEVIKENIKEPIKTKIVTEKKESISTIKKIKENTILLFANFNFFNRDHRAGYKKNRTIKPPEKPSRPIDKYDPLTPEIPVAVRPLPPEGILPDRPLPIRPITPEIPVMPIIIWEDGKDIAGTSYTLTHDITTSTNDGLRTEGGEIINEATITVMNGNSYGMRVEKDGNGINNGIINASKGVKAIEGGKIINNGLIYLSENIDTKIGMMAIDNGAIVNEETGRIEIESNGGVWNYGFKVGKDSTGINKGQLTLNGNGAGKFGMEALDNGIITNEETGKIEINSNDGTWNYGFKVGKDSTGINKGQLTLNGDGTGKFGMEALDNGAIVNEEIGKIEINSNGGIRNYGMSVKGNGIGTNKGTITLNGDGTASGMEALDSGTITNEKTIDINSNNGIGMSVSNEATAINKGIININSDSGKGMHAKNKGNIVNKKAINIDNDGYGMVANYESTAINKGTININGKNGVFNSGMYVGSTGIATNEGTIVMNSGSGMIAENNGTITNEETGVIEINDRVFSSGMDVGKGTAINKGRISINSRTSTGMVAMDGGVITNEKTIDINNTNGVGMKAINTSTSTAINKGTININGDYGTGIEVTKGATGINDDLGIINLNANNGIGIKVDGVGSSYVNNGEINIASGTTGNKKIVLSGGATFSNSGSIVADGEFNTNQMGNGQFIMSDGGTLEADKIKGDIYASGALAMGGYDDIYSTYKMLKTTNLEGDIISNSAMFDAHFTENTDENGFYDVVLDRKDFNTVVSNEKLGKILENNYEDNGNELKEDYYDALKLVSTEKGLDKAIEDSYGISYYPTLAKQTFEIAKDSNQVIVDQVLNNTKVRKTGETIAIAGVNTTKLKNDSYSNVSGYDTDLYSVYLGIEKQLNKDTRIGGIITIGKANTDSKDVEGSRDDYYYQGNIYYTYENDERLKFTSMIYGGITDTSLERTLAFGSLNETMKDDINNYYIGLNNELSKKYYFNRNYLKPKFELNFTYMNQDDISESGDQGLKIDGESSTSIETGLGLALGRDFYIDNGSKINLEGSVTGYAELGDPYKDLDSTFETLSTDKVKIDEYNNDDFYGDIMIGGSYETKESLKIFTKLGYRIENDSDGFIGNIGMNYLF